MSYLTDVSEDMPFFKPWENYEEPQSFRVGMTPAVCNNFDLRTDAASRACGDQTLFPHKTYQQQWTTGMPERDINYDRFLANNNGFGEYKWDVDEKDTSVQQNSSHVWEYSHAYFGDPGGGCHSQYVGPNYPDVTVCDKLNPDLTWDVAHRITLSNWSEWNCMASAFLAHPSHLTMTDEYILSPLPGQSSFDLHSQQSGFLKDRTDVFRRGDFIMRVQGMSDSLSLYTNDNLKRPNGWKTGISLTTSNPAAMSEDFSTGGFYMPVLTMGDNPFWRADPKHWVPILQGLKMDVMPYCAPLRKTRPVMYRFWDSPYSTALYGGPTFHCATVGGDDIQMANVPYYRKFLRDFMASDDSIMAWRSNLGLPENEDARYPHYYANYWKVVDALQGKCKDGPEEAPIWADALPGRVNTPTEFIGDKYDRTNVGRYYVPYFRYDPTGGPEQLLAGLNLSESRANHFVLLRDGIASSLMDALPLVDSDKTLAYPPDIRDKELTKLSMNMKRKMHQTGMHATNDHAYEDYFATFFHSGSWDTTHLNHKITTSNVGVISDKGMALVQDFMTHILNGADITDLLPDGIALEDKIAISGWFNNEVTNLILTSIENAKLTRLNEFRKWLLKNGKNLSNVQFRNFCKSMFQSYPKVQETISAFFDGLERAFGEMDISVINGGTSFIKAIGNAFAKAGVEAGTVALADTLAEIKKGAGDIASIPPAVWKKLQEMISKPVPPPQNIWDYLNQVGKKDRFFPGAPDPGDPFVDPRGDVTIDVFDREELKNIELEKFFGLEQVEDAIADRHYQNFLDYIVSKFDQFKSNDLSQHPASYPGGDSKYGFGRWEANTYGPEEVALDDVFSGAPSVVGLDTKWPLQGKALALFEKYNGLDSEIFNDSLKWIQQMQGKRSFDAAAQYVNKAEDANATVAEVEDATAALADIQDGLNTAQLAGGALESAEALTLSSVVAAAAPLVFMFAFSELLDYFIQKAEKEAEEAAAYKAAHDEMNAFYEGKVPLNTDFFTASEIARIKTLPFQDANISWGSPTERPYVRFDILTRLIVSNQMCLAMVDETWRKSSMGYDTQALIIHIRQTEWLSTCEAIRVLRLVDYSIRAPMWADVDKVDPSGDEKAFSMYHFPLTDIVPNGMIKEHMTPIPCLTPRDTPGMIFDGTTDLYGRIFGISSILVDSQIDSQVPLLLVIAICPSF